MILTEMVMVMKVLEMLEMDENGEMASRMMLAEMVMMLEMLEMERNYLYGEDDQDFANKNCGERCNNASRW